MRQSIAVRPAWDDRDPYFNALVASSWRSSDRDRVARALRSTGGPDTSNRSSMSNVPIIVSTTACKDAPDQLRCRST